jgi:hypothetical protein
MYIKQWKRKPRYNVHVYCSAVVDVFRTELSTKVGDCLYSSNTCEHLALAVGMFYVIVMFWIYVILKFITEFSYKICRPGAVLGYIV